MTSPNRPPGGTNGYYYGADGTTNYHRGAGGNTGDDGGSGGNTGAHGGAGDKPAPTAARTATSAPTAATRGGGEDDPEDHGEGDVADYAGDDVADHAGDDVAECEEDDMADDGAAGDGRGIEIREPLLEEPGPSSSTGSGAPVNGAALAMGWTKHGGGEAGGEGKPRSVDS